MNIEWGTIILETLGMTFVSTALAYLVGLPVGVILKNTSKDGLYPCKWVNIPLGFIVNFLRSIPCLILLIILLPLTRAIMGRGTGEWYTIIIPLFFATVGFVSRNVEQSLQGVDGGEIEAARSMGATDWQIICKVMIPEARSSLLIGLCLTLVNVIGYTSFAYNIGAGGLISEIYYYYSRNQGDFVSSWTFWLLVIVVVVLVEIIQELGLFLAKKLDKRKIAK